MAPIEGCPSCCPAWLPLSHAAIVRGVRVLELWAASLATVPPLTRRMRATEPGLAIKVWEMSGTLLGAARSAGHIALYWHRGLS